MSTTALYEKYIEQSFSSMDVLHQDQHVDGHTDSSSGDYYQDDHTDMHGDAG